jgi:hypothetical protein
VQRHELGRGGWARVRQRMMNRSSSCEAGEWAATAGARTRPAMARARTRSAVGELARSHQFGAQPITSIAYLQFHRRDIQTGFGIFHVTGFLIAISSTSKHVILHCIDFQNQSDLVLVLNSIPVVQYLHPNRPLVFFFSSYISKALPLEIVTYNDVYLCVCP